MMAVAVCVCASLPVSAAEYAEWATSHVNIYGAPGDASHIDQKTISHRNLGAEVVCNYISHTNPKASTGKITVQCLTYVIDDLVLEHSLSGKIVPDVGNLQDNVTVSVTYRFIAYTFTSEDSFLAKGNISAIVEKKEPGNKGY